MRQGFFVCTLTLLFPFLCLYPKRPSPNYGFRHFSSSFVDDATESAPGDFHLAGRFGMILALKVGKSERLNLIKA